MTQPASQDGNLSPDLLAQLWDEASFRERVFQEEAAGCDIEAGLEPGADLGRLLSAPEAFKQGARLQHLLMKQLKQQLRNCHLGAGMDAAVDAGEAILRDRLTAPTATLLGQLEQLLDLDAIGQQDALQALLHQIVNETLQAEDWQKIAAAAAERVRQQVIQQYVSTS